MDAMQIYEKLSRPPESALKTIKGGRLNGMTDINPQWRYKIMNQTFGLCGIGWKYKILKLWTEDGVANEKMAFAEVEVYIRDGDEWSEPIVGIGGSKLTVVEKSGPRSNDEGYKMAVTDAFGTALKMIGVAADIYAGKWDGDKYTTSPDSEIRELVLKIESYLNDGAIPESWKTKIDSYIQSGNAAGLRDVLEYFKNGKPA